jgi:alkanesulfonate monooxygenase SsuD/methylene tetrahydromethanopterin reductase-like flavin-dependent oxidoreductase (luciferase family)
LPNACDPRVAQESFERWLGYAAAADDLGFDWVSVSEHHYSPLILVPSTGPIAGALTQIVRRARIALLGPLVSINNPVRVAEEIAMLDQMSRGRLIVLLLRGTPSEFNAYEPIDAVLTQPKAQAATRLVRRALTDTAPFGWKDEFFDYPNIAIWPRPLQQPLPPMYFSGNSLNSAEFAARERLGLCMSFHRPESVAGIVAHYRAEARRCGWEPTSDQIVYRGFGLVADTDARAAELEATFLPPHLRFLLDGPTPGATASSPRKVPEVEQTRLADATPFGMGRMLFAGSPDTVVERLRIFQSLTGVGVVDLVFSSAQIAVEDERRSIELFGREVLPRIHAFDAAA